MNPDAKTSEWIESRLRDRFRNQPVIAADEEWYRNVMQRIRLEARPAAGYSPWLDRIAWRVAAVATAAAVIVSIVGAQPHLSTSDLAWEIATSTTRYEWLLASKE